MAVLYVSDAHWLLVPMLTINEIFHSIQGESTHTGRPCVFVRLTACDLRCSWCDTPDAFHEGRKMSIDQVVADVAAFECPVVEITGGEPLLQPRLSPDERAPAAGPYGPPRDRWSPQRRAGPRWRRPDHRREVSGERRVREERLVEPGSPDADRRGQVRRAGSGRTTSSQGRSGATRSRAVRRDSAVARARCPARPASSRRGFSPTVCRSGCSCRRTSIWSADARGVSTPRPREHGSTPRIDDNRHGLHGFTGSDESHGGPERSAGHRAAQRRPRLFTAAAMTKRRL